MGLSKGFRGEDVEGSPLNVTKKFPDQAGVTGVVLHQENGCRVHVTALSLSKGPAVYGIGSMTSRWVVKVK